MLILSQDKNIIINFENVANINIEKCYNESLKEEEFTYDILVYIVSSGLTRIGKYDTEERAKEILQEIIKAYRDYRTAECDGYTNVLQETAVYEMPEKIKEVNMENKQMNISLGFSIDLEKILNYLVENNMYMAQFNNINIRYLGNKEDTANGNRQVFEVERKI